MSENHDCCNKPSGVKRIPWYRHRIFLLLCGIGILLFVSPQVPYLEPFRNSFLDYAKMMILPVLIGLIAGGLIDYYIPKEYISKHLAGQNKRTILYATSLGLLMSACSHGILALSMELHKKGASGPAVISFLLASPWANLPITILLIGFFGLKGFLIIFGALLVSLSTGYMFQALENRNLIEKNPHHMAVEPDFSVRRDLLKRIQSYQFSSKEFLHDLSGIGRGMIDLADMVIWWILIGMILASFVSAFVPAHFFHNYLSANTAGLSITLLIATVMEVCSEGTSPIAFEIYRQTHAFGNAFAFLMGGVVTDYTEVGLVWTHLGKKTAIWMLVLTIPQVFLLGWIFNWLKL